MNFPSKKKTTTTYAELSKTPKTELKRNNSANNQFHIQKSPDKQQQQQLQHHHPPSMRNIIPINKKNPIADLMEQETDTYEDLKIKNSKLRKIIVQASTKIADMNKKYMSLENEYKLEKATILSELDKITNNYKLYAESYKQLPKIQNEYTALMNKYKQNNKVIENYLDNIKQLLNDFIQMHNSIHNYIENTQSKYNNNYYHNRTNDAFGFIEFTKKNILRCIFKYKNEIDSVNFGKFYGVYHSFVQSYSEDKENTIQDTNCANVNKHKKTFQVRKKEYINTNNNDNNNNSKDYCDGSNMSSNGNTMEQHEDALRRKHSKGKCKGNENKYKFNKNLIDMSTIKNTNERMMNNNNNNNNNSNSIDDISYNHNDEILNNRNDEL
jgi:hypothetical protein